MKIFSLALLRLAIGAAIATASVGCSDPTPDASAQTASKPKAIDLQGYCHASCERAAKCGFESLSKATKGNPVEMPILNDARDALPKTIASCEASCAANEPDDDHRAAFEQAERCLDQTECDTFAACLEKVKL